MLTQEDMITNMQIARGNNLVKLYEKFGSFDIRLATPGELIPTMIDGVVETIKAAKEGDAVVRGPKGENYIIDHEKVTTRYKLDKPLTDQFQSFETTGFVDAYEYIGDSIEFMASWGTSMIANSGDFLATPTNPPGTIINMTERWPKEVYRIEKEIFHQTYKEVK